MTKLPKPDPPSFNGCRFRPSERIAILSAATKGYVFRAGKLGYPPDKEDKRADYRHNYIPIGVLRRLHQAGVMRNGTGYGTHILTPEFTSQCLKAFREFAKAEAAYREDIRQRKALSAERKAQRELRKQKKGLTP